VGEALCPGERTALDLIIPRGRRGEEEEETRGRKLNERDRPTTISCESLLPHPCEFRAAGYSAAGSGRDTRVRAAEALGVIVTQPYVT